MCLFFLSLFSFIPWFPFPFIFLSQYTPTIRHGVPINHGDMMPDSDEGVTPARRFGVSILRWILPV
ncbi:hypothetical protein BDV41DRAFT_547871 [Aspergillus transmontanensis]|uniref:Uncharacterized protein n=1 Tax=Aspergillus transmontanensis TaxID=1034304 RepID=A0A5N6VMM0_9EURO|nr:hypothetical protein BDV41DRAFT_547871 [Aspergillus transmontanensis]